jgi:MFS family permease
VKFRLLPESATGTARRILLARGLRAFADGFVSVLLPVYLLELGFSATGVGVIATATLLGSALLTLAVGLWAGGIARPALLLVASMLMVATGIAFGTIEAFWPLAVIAFVGTINPSTGDVSVFLPVEQSILAESVDPAERTALFARYSLVGSLLGAFGTLLAVAPGWLEATFGWMPRASLQAMFFVYAFIGVVAALIYRGVRPPPKHAPVRQGPLGPSRRTVYRLAALFSVDAFGGGFFVQSLLALWLFARFDMPVATAAQVFFAMNLLAAVSFLAAVPVARRFGLINTMVFTHLPSNLCLIAVAFVDHVGVAIALLCVRSLLSQMDVPTRTSYVMAVVTLAERAAAASVTAVPRSLASSLSPTLAGWLLSLTSFGWPLLIGGTLKAAYDLVLLAQFRHVKPPEEGRRQNSDGRKKTLDNARKRGSTRN